MNKEHWKDNQEPDTASKTSFNHRDLDYIINRSTILHLSSSETRFLFIIRNQDTREYWEFKTTNLGNTIDFQSHISILKIMDVNQEMEVNVMKEVVENQERLLEILHKNARHQSNGIRTLQDIGNIRRRKIIELRKTVDKDGSELQSLQDTSNRQRQEISMVRNSIQNQWLELSSVPNTYDNLLHENRTMRVTVDNQRRELSLLFNSIDEKNTDIHTLQNRVTSGLRDNIKHEATIKKLEFEVDTLDKMYKSMRELHAGKIHKLSEYESKIESLEAENNHLKKAIERLNEIVAQANGEHKLHQ